MNVRKCLTVSSGFYFLLLAPVCYAQFDNQSLNGCYVNSYYGNILGPSINVDETGQLVPDPSKLVLHGYSTAGRWCADGNGNITEVSGTANLAGLCVDTYTGSGTYASSADGTGTGAVSVTISTVSAGCSVLGINAGDTQTFSFSSALEADQGCGKVVITSAETPTGPQPIVAEGEFCPQVTP